MKIEKIKVSANSIEFQILCDCGNRFKVIDSPRAHCKKCAKIMSLSMLRFADMKIFSQINSYEDVMKTG